MSRDFRKPINPRTEPHPVRYAAVRDPQTLRAVIGEDGEPVYDLDAPVIERARCKTCGERKEARLFSDYPSRGTIALGPCIDCSRLIFEELTSAPVTGSKGKDDAWKVAHLHLYYESFYRKRCQDLGVPAIIRSFSIQELLRTYGNGRNECYMPKCTEDWSDLKYLVPLEDYGSHSMENVRPACQEHI